MTRSTFILQLSVIAFFLLPACSGDSPPDGPSCPQSQVICDDVCVDTQTDPRHCGTCDISCETSEICNGAGVCELSCQAGLIACDGLCADPLIDRRYCGASADCQAPNAGNTCVAGEICNGAGVCELSCQAGLLDCNGSCVDPLSDRSFCGASGDCQAGNAGAICGAGEVCNGAGVCELSCQAGLLECDGSCVDPLIDRSFCGATGDCQPGNAGVICGAGQICNGAGLCELSCQTGLLDCNGSCVDPLSDRSFCGATGDCQASNAGAICGAGEICNGTGLCEATCQASLIDCNGSCVDPLTDRGFCGATSDCLAGNAGANCGVGEICNGAGVCELSCQAGLLDCNGTCIDPQNNRGFCGATGDCLAGNAGTSCGAGEICNGAGLCEASCQAGLLDCSGTCVDPLTDRGFCGATSDCLAGNAGALCGTGELCNGAGLCELSCQASLLDCSGTCIDPLSDRSFCGATGDCLAGNAGALCGAGEICDGAGLCELSCQAGLLDCNGTCIDPLNHRGFCGATGDCLAGNTGTNCATGEICNGAGLCEANCATGLLDCGGTCIDPDTDPTYCGASGDCLAGNAGVVCAGSQTCIIGTCTGGTSETHDFPVAGDTRVGAGSGDYFWRLGDHVEGSRTTALPSIGTIDIHLVLELNALGCDTQDVEVSINGTVVGSFSITGSDTVIDRTFIFSSLSGPIYTIRYETVRQVSSGCGASGYSNTGSTVTLYAG